MSQLEDYFEKQNQLPLEVHRNLKLIKELDERVYNHSKRIEHLQRIYVNNEKSKKYKENEKLKGDIDKLYEDSINLSNEKIAIADTTYTLVDSAVKDLDDSLKKFEDQLKNSVGTDSKAKRSSIVQPLSKYQKDKRKKIHQEIEQSKEIFQIGAGQHEPVYCYCSKPSYGQMIMCDNQLCEKEWFHLSCTNLKDFPNDSTPWYCSNDCRKEGRVRISKLQQSQQQQKT